MKKANIPMLRELRAWVIAQDRLRGHGLRSEWDQNKWLSVKPCGTVCCVAGKILLLSPGKLEFTYYAKHWIIAGTYNGSVAEAATVILGIDHDSGEILFDYANEVQDVVRYIDDIIEIGRVRYV